MRVKLKHVSRCLKERIHVRMAVPRTCAQEFHMCVDVLAHALTIDQAGQQQQTDVKALQGAPFLHIRPAVEIDSQLLQLNSRSTLPCRNSRG